MKFHKALKDMFLQENITGERDRCLRGPSTLLLFTITASLRMPPAPLHKCLIPRPCNHFLSQSTLFAQGVPHPFWTKQKNGKDVTTFGVLVSSLDPSSQQECIV